MWAKYIGPIYNTAGLPYFGTGVANSMLSVGKSLMPAAAAAKVRGGLGGIGGLLGGMLGGGAPVGAGLGNAISVGGLSVPSSWAAAVPAMGSPGTALPISSINAANPDMGVGNLMGGMPAPVQEQVVPVPEYGFRPTVIPRLPVAG